MTRTAHHIAEAVAEYVADPSRIRMLELFAAYDTVEHANAELHRLTGVRCFFPSAKAFEQFRRTLALPATDADSAPSREWGDFQTPPALTDQVCRYLVNIGVHPRIIIEPNFGLGNFVLATLKTFPTARLVYGVEIQERYAWHLKMALLNKALNSARASAEIELCQDDIFTHRFPREILEAQDVLVVGNPPWVTSAELGALGSRNLPVKKNVKSLSGLDALTGKSNFDIGEYVLLRMLDLFSKQRGTLAMLCKNSVIKNIVELLPKREYAIANVRALGIDASRQFGAAVDASLLVMDLGAADSSFTCQVATLDNPRNVTRSFGWVRNKFVSNVEDYTVNAALDGKSPLVWRQGLKHDCARIMELTVHDGVCVNGNAEVVDVEEQWVYWLLKSSDLRNFEVAQARKKVIVTQRHLGEETARLRKDAPKLWRYLDKHREYFDKRRSSIYRDKPRFAIFGVGDYAFKPFKVAISGLYKEPFFSLALPLDNRPVMLDDTCYFLGFDTYLDALFTVSLLNTPIVKQFLQSIVFADAKRPFTKEVLMRIDLNQVARKSSFQMLGDAWESIGFKPRVPVCASDFEDYKQRVLCSTQEDLQLSLAV